MEDKRQKFNFDEFKKKIATRIPITTRAYNGGKFGYRATEPIKDDFSLDEILYIIRSGDIEALRDLSRYYYRVNSNYRNNVDFLAHLPLYETVVIPLYQTGKVSENQVVKSFELACKFIDKLDVPNNFTRISVEWIKNGVYYGLLRQNGDNFTIQDLPINFCRSRFKDFNNFNILEFNLHYFESIYDTEMQKEAVSTFPPIVQKAWKQWVDKKLTDPWVIIPTEQGGISFSFSVDQMIPLLIASIPELKKLDDAVKRESERDENELYKLLIQQMPIDKNGELVFPLEEVADIHQSTATMLSDVDTVDVLTTFGNTTLESLQESSSATQSADRIEKYKKNAWDALGRGNILFNPDGSSSLAYAIKKDEALMISYLNIYEAWLRYQLNYRFGKKNFAYDFQILPITVFNREDLQSAYFRSAQYGNSKMFAGVAMGIKQLDQLSLMHLENDILKMHDKMIPLQSSYTTAGGKSRDLTNTGGRPELPDEEKSEKTQANIAAAG